MPHSSAESTKGIIDPEAGAARFRLIHTPPRSELAGFVERHWTVEWRLDGGEAFTQQVLPHPCVNIASEPGLIGVHGIPLERFSRTLASTGVACGTKFRPGAFAAIAAIDARELNNRVVPLGEIFGSDGEELESRIASVRPDRDRQIELVESFLIDRLPAPDPRFGLVTAVVGEMLRVPVETTVSELAERHAVSPRTLQRLFAEYVGVGPKWVLKRYRIHEAAERLAHEPDADIARLAAELGYFDQPHFTTDFTNQIGTTPAAYAEACAAAAAEPVAA